MNEENEYACITVSKFSGISKKFDNGAVYNVEMECRLSSRNDITYVNLFMLSWSFVKAPIKHEYEVLALDSDSE